MPQPQPQQIGIDRPTPGVHLSVGYWSALAATLLGIVYAIVVGIMAVMGKMTLPPPEGVALFAAIVTILSGPLVVALLAAIHYATPVGRQVFSLLGVVFGAAFMVMVSINRFVQLAVVRLSFIEGNSGGLERFMPYGPRSAMFALEMVGWEFFLGLALLCAAFAFPAQGITGAIRWSFLIYAVLGLPSAVLFTLGSPLSAIGFVAWGLVFPIGTALLTIWFGRLRRSLS